jgi:type IV secretory pathway ATPase VirB11/archaellum biosynthesis ATPase
MTLNTPITITVSGPTASGKTSIMDYIGDALRNVGISVTIDYGTDGDPHRPPPVQAKCIEHVRDRAHIIIREQNTPRTKS